MNARAESFRPHHDVEALRVPPQSVEAEQAVLGGLMLSNEAMDLVLDVLTEADFYRRDHRLIYRAMVELHEKTPPRPFDAVTLGDWFEANGLAEQIGGPSYLIELASTTPSAANIRAYAEIVKKHGVLRALIEAGTEIVNDGFQPEGRDPEDLVAAHVTKLAGLVRESEEDEEDLRAPLKRMYQRLVERSENPGKLDGLSTGFVELDRVLNGLKGGRFYVVASRPKMGKSTLAMDIAAAISIGQRIATAVYNFEMMPEELTERLTCAHAGVEHDRFRTGRLEEEDWTRVNRAIKEVGRAPIFITKPKNARAQAVCARARRLKAKKKVGAFVVDYFQLFDTSGSESRQQGLSEASRALKMLAIETDTPVICLSQLSRKCEERTNKRPIPADLRDTGALEQDADAVIFLYRDEVYDKESRYAGTVEVDVALQRNGPSEMVRLASELNYCRFANLPDDWHPKPAENDGDGGSRGRKAKRLGE